MGISEYELAAKKFAPWIYDMRAVAFDKNHIILL